MAWLQLRAADHSLLHDLAATPESSAQSHGPACGCAGGGSAHHVVLGDALCDANNQVQLSFHPFKNGLGCKWRRHIEHRGIGFCLFDSFLRGGKRQHFKQGGAGCKSCIIASHSPQTYCNPRCLKRLGRALNRPQDNWVPKRRSIFWSVDTIWGSSPVRS